MLFRGGRERHASVAARHYPRCPTTCCSRPERYRKRFGGVRAVEDRVDLGQARRDRLDHRPERRGKTSLLNMISGFYRPDTGTITVEGIDTTRYRPADVAALGIARHLSEHRAVQRHDRARHIMLGRHVRMKSGVLSAFLYWGRPKRRRWRTASGSRS